MVSFIKAGSEEMPAHIKALVMGQSGAGKTWLGATAPNPVIMLTERNGIQSIRNSNPNALVSYCSTADECRDFLLAATNGDLPEGTQSIVVDGITEIQQIMIDDILSKKTGEDRKMSLPDWGILGDRMRRFLRCLRDLPYHVIVTSLVNHETNESTGETRVFPLVQSKKLPAQMAQYFNVVGLLFKRESTEEKNVVISRKVMVEGPGRFLVKPCEPLTGILEADLSLWVDMWKASATPMNGKKKSSKKRKSNVTVAGGK